MNARQPVTAQAADSLRTLGPNGYTLRAAARLAERYETGQHDPILRSMLDAHPASPEHRALLAGITAELLGQARRGLSVRLAAEDRLMTQDVSVLLARVAIAAYPFARLITGQSRPRHAVFELLVAAMTVAFVHENAATTDGARKLRDEVDVIKKLLEEGETT